MKTTAVGICTNAISGLFHSQGKCARRKINRKTVKREGNALRPKFKVFWVNAEGTWIYNALIGEVPRFLAWGGSAVQRTEFRFHLVST